MNSNQKPINNRSQSEQNDTMLADEGDNNIVSGIEPEVSMMDYAWNEDKIEIDFKTGKQKHNSFNI